MNCEHISPHYPLLIPPPTPLTVSFLTSLPLIGLYVYLFILLLEA